MARAFFDWFSELTHKHVLLLLATALLSCALYGATSALAYRVGFPLDDSWIHAAFARNLAMHGQWAFRLGELSDGSTSPLWTLLLVPGFWLHLEPLWWSYLLGVVALAALGIVSEIGVRHLAEGYSPPIPWVGIFVATEWHLAWAAMSGMETLLHALLVTACLVLLMTGSRRYLGLGLLIGLSVWVRPDGLTLLFASMVTIAAQQSKPEERWRNAIWHLFGFATAFLPYLVFNLWLSGRPMPNTFYAKQAEYAAWQARPALARLAAAAGQLLTGPGILVVPGLAAFLWQAAKRLRQAQLAVLGWSIIYVTVYSLRLPPYQHGRYLMPAMPVLLIAALAGYIDLRRMPTALWNRPSILNAWDLGIASLAVGFLLMGAHAYGQDVGLIETEMVNTAQWIQASVEPGALVAAHDIGALGYFDNHPLIDLAGLVSPEVVPFMRNETALAQYLDRRGANYLVAFPGLYPLLEQDAVPVYSSGGKFAPSMGVRNLTVYCWSCR
jgi:hypothetical protein